MGLATAMTECWSSQLSLGGSYKSVCWRRCPPALRYELFTLQQSTILNITQQLRQPFMAPVHLSFSTLVWNIRVKNASSLNPNSIESDKIPEFPEAYTNVSPIYITKNPRPPEVQNQNYAAPKSFHSLNWKIIRLAGRGVLDWENWRCSQHHTGILSHMTDEKSTFWCEHQLTFTFA